MADREASISGSASEVRLLRLPISGEGFIAWISTYLGEEGKVISSSGRKSNLIQQIFIDLLNTYYV